MENRIRTRTVSSILRLSLPAALCSSAIAIGAAPASSPSIHTFVDTSDNIQLNYPADWTAEKGKTAVLDVAAPPSAADGYSSLSLDVPHLPPHFPGMISEGMVERGYVGDLRKNQIPDLHKDESVAITVAGGSGQRVKCSGHTDGKPAVDVAVICFHGNRVYILSCDSDDKGYAAARSALDAAVASLRWLK